MSKKHVSIVICGHVDAGKCLKKGTLCLMYDGKFKKVEDIVVGDRIMGDDSSFRTVLNTSSGYGKMYNVIQTNGQTYSVNENHILSLMATNIEGIFYDKTRNKYRYRWLEKIYDNTDVLYTTSCVIKEKRFNTEIEAHDYLKIIEKQKNIIQKGDIIDISVKNYINLPVNVQNALKGYSVSVEYDVKHIFSDELSDKTKGNEHLLRLTNQVNNLQQLDPYALGYWLGDGTSAEPEITTADEEIIHYFKQLSANMLLKFKKKGNSVCSYRITSGEKNGKQNRNEFTNCLKRLNLINNKHIPFEYLFSNRNNRLKLLAGLIDSDGHYTHNTYDMCFKSEKLADDMILLSRSLGFKAYKHQVEKVCTNSNNGPMKGTYYRFCIKGNNLDEIPVLLERKKSYNSQNIGRNANVTAIKIEESSNDNYYGFEIDGNGRFLLEDMTVSHNSTTTGRLIFELGGINSREMEKLQKEADALGKSSFAFAFYMDRQADERARGVTIQCTTKEFFTESKHYTIIDAPGHRDFIKNMLTGASQADVALLLVPADGNFTTSIAKGDHKAGEVQGQTRQHALLLNLLGVKQLIIGVNKMDCDTAGYSKERYEEVAAEMVNMLTKVGWKKDFISNSVPIIPLAGFKGDNLITQSPNMPWWKGVDITNTANEKVHIHTLLDALEKMVTIPTRNSEGAMRLPISGVFKIKGVGDVLTGRVEQGTLKPGSEVMFLPTHTEANPCTGKIFSVEMHHVAVPEALPGDNVGLNVKNLPKANMPRSGDIMVLTSDKTLRTCKSFTAQVMVLSHPGELKVGYSPIAFVRTARSAVKIEALKWKMGKETGGKKMDNPGFLKSNDAAEVVFTPIQPFVVDTFKNCEGLGRIAIMEGGTVVMLGKVVDVEFI